MAEWLERRAQRDIYALVERVQTRHGVMPKKCLTSWQKDKMHV